MKPEEIGILIVDDEASVRDSLYQWFKADGYRVDTAEEATGALKKIQDSPWDIILLDVRMPGMDGIELQRRIKQIDPSIVTIIITAHASVETAVQALKEGAFDYVTKPIDPDDLGRLVRNAVEKRKLVAENIQLRRQIEEKLIESSVDGIVVADREGKILIFNKGAEEYAGLQCRRGGGENEYARHLFRLQRKTALLPAFAPAKGRGVGRK